jgi:hypothetical protein
MLPDFRVLDIWIKAALPPIQFRRMKQRNVLSLGIYGRRSSTFSVLAIPAILAIQLGVLLPDLSAGLPLPTPYVDPIRPKVTQFDPRIGRAALICFSIS